MSLISTTVVAIGIIVFAGGLVKGIAGFGYAVVATALLATILDPGAAVVIMILPTLAANVVLLGELDRSKITACLGRFWPFLGTAVIGTAGGMLFLRSVSANWIALALGLLTTIYVVVKQPWVALPGEGAVTEWCVTDGYLSKATLGLVAGIVFGATNIAVQVVAYLDSLDLDHATFVGVLAMVLVGIAGLRVGLAAGLGLYTGGNTFMQSVLAIVPGLAGVSLGSRLRASIPESIQIVGVLSLLTVIGIRLTLAGLGIL